LLIDAFKHTDADQSMDLKEQDKSLKINASLVKQSPAGKTMSRNGRILNNFPSDLELRYEKLHSPKNF